MEGLRSWIEKNPDFRLVGSASTAGAAIQLANAEKPMVTLLDLHLPDNMNIQQAIKELATTGTKVVIFSAEDRKYFVDLTLQSGAAGFISKSENYGTITKVLREVCFTEGRFLSENLKQNRQSLTDVEKELLAMLARGMKYDDIANLRVTSAHTVRKQCDRLQTKLRLTSREELIAWAVSNGYSASPLSTENRSSDQ
jgi:DNA-binding NarL/FixJ family response regulator